MDDLSLATLADLDAPPRDQLELPLLNGWTGSVRLYRRVGLLVIQVFNLDSSAATDQRIVDFPEGWQPIAPTAIRWQMGAPNVLNEFIFVRSTHLQAGGVPKFATGAAAQKVFILQ